MQPFQKTTHVLSFVRNFLTYEDRIPVEAINVFTFQFTFHTTALNIVYTNKMIHTIRNQAIESLDFMVARLTRGIGEKPVAVTFAVPLTDIPYSMSNLVLATVVERRFM